MDDFESPKYKIVFEKLNEAVASGDFDISLYDLQEDIQDIRELVDQLCTDDTEPSRLYTST